MNDFPKLYQDKVKPGIVRFEGGDDLTGILAGVHAPEIVHRCNNFARLEDALEKIRALEESEADEPLDDAIAIARKALNPERES